MGINKLNLTDTMLSSHRTSFLIITAVIFLLPLFFIPGGALDLGSAKSLLISLGVVLASLFFLYSAWREKELSLPKHALLFVAMLLPVVYLLSALLSTPSSLSLLGYNFEVGTFGYILLGAVLMTLIAATVSETSRALQVTIALFGSLSLLALFVAVQILSGGEWLGLGNFSGAMGNPLGNWTDLAVVFGLLATMAMLALGMLPLRRSFKAMLYVVFALSVVLLVVINFSTALYLTLGASVILCLYFSKIENSFYSVSKGEMGERGDKHSGNFFTRATFLPIVLGLISLLFLINPTISENRGNLADVVSGAFGVSNTEVHPTLSSTLSISKAVLSQEALLGSGPNSFGRDWLIYKPTDINTTPFWSVIFPFGAGFIPTQVAATGILGTFLWLAFFALLVALSLKAVSHIPESRAERFTIVSAMVVALFLWTSTFLYTPSAATMMIAFAFAGLLLATSRGAGLLSSRVIAFKDAPTRLVSALLFVLVALGALSLGWFGLEKTLASFHFKRAVDLSSIEGTSIAEVESHLDQAVKFAPLDTYYLAISRLNFSKAQAAANAATGTPEQNRAIFEDALSKSIAAARSAVAANPAGYGNWVSLGLIYSSLVPEPLAIEGAYETAQFAYSEAYRRNPNNPELPLLLAQLEINKGNFDNARSYIMNSIALKQDYADAYLLLAQLEASQNNIPGAIASTERLAILSPDNAGIHFELGLLKYSNADYEGAVASLGRALQIMPEYANAKYYLGLSLAQLGRNEEARVQFEELLVTNPDSPELQAALEELE